MPQARYLPRDDMRGNSPAAPHEEPFSLLVDAVSSPNIKLRDVSAAVVATASPTAEKQDDADMNTK